MKNLFLLFLILPSLVFSKSFLISNVPLPKVYVQNTTPYPCSDECLREYLQNDMIFSFLAYADKKLEDTALNDARMINISILNVGSNLFNSNLKIALLLPYNKIGKYASSTTNSALAYLLTKNHSFKLKSYKIKNEDMQEIQKSLKLIKDDGYSYIIAPLTLVGAKNISIINPSTNIYFPTINKKDINTTSKNLYFGGIDYHAQSDKLLREAVSPLVIFYDQSPIGRKLAKYEEDTFKYKNIMNENIDDTNQTQPLKVLDTNKTVIKFSIPRRTTNLEKYLKNNVDLNSSSCFINTPIVKTGMIMSQLTLYDTNTTNITNILSTQINYDPLLLSMTQYIDRKDMIIANSITQNKSVLTEANALLGNDITYDWINYTTTIGVDYFYSLITSQKREYNIPLEDNQMKYKIELIKPSYSKFIPYTND